VSDFRTAKDRAYYARRRRAALGAAAMFVAELEELEGHPGLETYSSLRRQYRQEFAVLESVLRHELVRNGGRLTQEIRVRDIVGEQRRDDEEERDAIQNGRTWQPPSVPRPLYKPEWATFGVLRSIRFFLEGEDPQRSIAGEVRVVRSSLAELQKADSLTAQKLIFKGLAACFVRIREQVESVRELPVSLGDDNLNCFLGESERFSWKLPIWGRVPGVSAGSRRWRWRSTSFVRSKHSVT